MIAEEPLPLSHTSADGWIRHGTVAAVSRRKMRAVMPGLAIGACVQVERRGRPDIVAEVVDLDGTCATCVPLGDSTGVVTGARASSSGARIGSFVGSTLLGRDTDAWGRADGVRDARVICADDPCGTFDRVAINRALYTGVAAIDAFATLGYGQRIALFAGAGVGKTSLLRSIVQSAAVDARVIALVGERGREAAELIESLRADPRRSTTTVVCATADAPALERLAAIRTATLHARALAWEGRDVLLVVDSLTRAATAWREHALEAGESPAHRGHPPSLASVLASLVERAGAWKGGSVTGIYSVLVDGDDVREPVTDSVRGLLDGHIVLSRRLAEAGSFPAIDVLRSLSRLMPSVASDTHLAAATTVRAALATLERSEDLFAIGAYEPGGDAALDAAVAVRGEIAALLHGEAAMAEPLPVRTLEALASIAGRLSAASTPAVEQRRAGARGAAKRRVVRR
ncbi:MAG TPA: EscN/YscN/HrcN family type III secretion system ATPase [Candidatus Eremiobacteraceae bacterium]|nr:EscN/YscN/HrcN family type III secretion system ATPase [Candidatus Eremiobacteraceae bacterium]